MTMSHERHVKLAAILTGVCTSHADWRDPALLGYARIDIGLYVANAHEAEAAKPRNPKEKIRIGRAGNASVDGR